MEPITMAALAGAGALMKGAGALGSFREQRRLERSLRELNRTPMERYTIDPRVQQMYSQAIGEASNPLGYGGATMNNFRNSMGRNLRGRYANALSLGGGTGARGINAVLNNQGLDQMANMYMGDENMRRSNRLGALGRAGSYASQFQNIRDRNTSFNQNYRLRLEQALGEGIRSQRDYRRNMLSGAGSDLMTAGIMGAYGGFGGGKEQVDTGSGLGFNPYENYTAPKLERGSLGASYNRGLVSNRNRMRSLGAYDTNSFDFSNFDDGSPVRRR